MSGSTAGKNASMFTVIAVGWILAGCNVANIGRPIITLTPSSTSTRTPTRTPTFTLTSTFTPTTIPLIQRNLSAIALHASDLPEGFQELEGRSGPECMGELYSDTPEVHANLIHGFNRSFLGDGGATMYSSSLFLYDDAESAKASYRAIASDLQGQTLELPNLGAEYRGGLTVDESAGISMLFIVWRDGVAVMDLLYLGLENPDVGGVVRLALTMQKRVMNPEFAAEDDGSPRIGFFAGEKLYLVSADGTGLTCIAKRPVGSFSFSPDGKRLVFHSHEPSGENRLYFLNLDGSGLTRIDSVKGSRPLWSPKGDRILFVNNEDSGSLYSIDGHGESPTPLTDFPPGEFSWYQKGEKIGLTQVFPSSIWVMNMNSDGSELTLAVKLLPFPYEGCCEWSPDGRYILYSSDRGDEIYKYHLFIMDGDGSGQRRLTDNVDQEWHADWSPNGERIVFVYSYLQRVTTISPDGTDPFFLADSTDYISCPAWSSDGARIAYLDHSVDRHKFYSIDADGGKKTHLFSIESYNITCPVWVPE